MSRLVVAGLAAALILSGCSPTRPTSPPVIATGAAPSATPPSPSPQRRTITSGLDVPWDFAVLPDGSTLITLRDRGELVRVVEGAAPQLVAKVPGVVAAGEGGLLGLALSPSFASDQFIYLYLTAAEDNRVVRFGYSADGLNQATPIITGIPKAGNHNGGRLRFGPDGDLYISTGDAGDGRNAQDTDSLAGKILRIKADGSIPGDNPFGNAVYSYGHRNVQGVGWDGEGTMYASEFGQNTWDELNIITPGGNYGWPQTEGMTDVAGLTAPELVWRTDEASPSGIAVTPEGRVFIAALRGERVWATQRADDGMSDPQVVLDGLGRVRAVEVIDGRLWVLTNNTARGTPRGGDDRLLEVPVSG